MDAKKRIEAAKAALEKAQRAKLTAETQLEMTKKQKEEVVKQMLEMGVMPDTIAAEIEGLDTYIEKLLTELEGLIPNV